MDALPFFDDDIVTANEEAQRKKQEAKERRVKAGIDDAIEAKVDDLTPAQVAELTMEQREARWGFSHAELQAAAKVVNILYSSPSLYAGDPELAETRLYTMISRDRKAKRGNKESLKQAQNENRSRRQKELRDIDQAALKKTQMRKERDAALNAMLLPPPPSDDDDEEEDEETADPSPAPEGGAVAVISPSAESAGPLGIVAPAPTKDNRDLRVNRRQKCHTCKSAFVDLHHYYYALCRPCGDLNFLKRNQSRDLHGKNVLLTGCRIKIGYAMALSLLRCGATLIGTTRFVHDCQQRLAMEPDYLEWKDRVHLFAIDLRDLWMVTQFCAFLKTKFGKLFAIVNNAAQTIARPPEYTAHLRANEQNPDPAAHAALRANPATVEWMSFMLRHTSLEVGTPLQLEAHPVVPGTQGLPHLLSEKPTPTTEAPAPVEAEAPKGGIVAAFPAGNVYDRYDTAAEARDQREENSWTLNMDKVDGGEAAEVMAINGLSPFVLNSKLKPMLLDRTGDDPQEKRFVINVSAMEGQFYRFKQTTHPHTNMAKAALNMMTRTSSPDYARDLIFMNAVDTGWITDESPHTKKQRRAEGHVPCPLDEIDAAARCLDLIYMDSAEHGKFWKDYHEIPW